MKLVIQDPNLLAAFQKVNGKEGVASAKVLYSNDKSVKLAALGGAPIELKIEGLTKTHTLTLGQEIQFTADGAFAVEPAITAPQAKEKPERMHSGGSSPLAASEKSNRYA